MNTQNNAPTKKKKYWLIPVCIGVIGAISLILNVVFTVVRMSGVETNIFLNIIGSFATFATGLCFLLFVPSIIIAVVLQSKK